MPRRPETWVSLCNVMLKLRGISRRSAILRSVSPQSNNRKDNSLWVTPFISRERPNVEHAIAGYLRLPQPTPGGRVGVTSAWSPLGNFLEGQAHPNVFAFHRTRFFYFCDVKLFVFAFRWFRVFH